MRSSGLARTCGSYEVADGLCQLCHLFKIPFGLAKTDWRPLGDFCCEVLAVLQQTSQRALQERSGRRKPNPVSRPAVEHVLQKRIDDLRPKMQLNGIPRLFASLTVPN